MTIGGVDGKNQGVAVEKITSDFPVVKLAEVEEEINNGDVKNTNL